MRTASSSIQSEKPKLIKGGKGNHCEPWCLNFGYLKQTSQSVKIRLDKFKIFKLRVYNTLENHHHIYPPRSLFSFYGESQKNQNARLTNNDEPHSNCFCKSGNKSYSRRILTDRCFRESPRFIIEANLSSSQVMEDRHLICQKMSAYVQSQGKQTWICNTQTVWEISKSKYYGLYFVSSDMILEAITSAVVYNLQKILTLFYQKKKRKRY